VTGPAIALQMRGVQVDFGGLRAVDVDHLTVRSGRIVGLVGANGAGKTTLFDVISGFVSPTRGEILLDGVHDLRRMSPARRARLGVGRSFQNALLFESLTVAETLAVAFDKQLRSVGVVGSVVAARSARRAETRVGAQVDELIAMFGLEAFRNKFISELSTGSRRIVDLAAICATRPRIVLLDEPSSGIAQREVEALADVLRRVQRELAATLLVIEHDMPMLRSLADEMYAMETGRVIAHGTPDEVLTDPDVVRSYLGTDSSALERSGTLGVAS
jgi:branched-chain amino acid transport system ATP-binding protein